MNLTIETGSGHLGTENLYRTKCDLASNLRRSSLRVSCYLKLLVFNLLSICSRSSSLSHGLLPLSKQSSSYRGMQATFQFVLNNTPHANWVINSQLKWYDDLNETCFPPL
jgi:hypothetical protein